MYEPARAMVHQGYGPPSRRAGEPESRRAGILGIAALSGPSNLSRSQWTSRTAVPTGFKRISPTAGGKYRSALFDRCTHYSARARSFREYPPHVNGNENGVHSGSIPIFHSNITTSILSLYIIKSYSSPEHRPVRRGSLCSPSFRNKLPGYCFCGIVRDL